MVQEIKKYCCETLISMALNRNNVSQTICLNVSGGGGIDVLNIDDRQNLKIIIVEDDAVTHEKLERQIKQIGLEDCLFSTRVICCDRMHVDTLLGFFDESLGFCCASDNKFHGSYPRFPYLDTAEETLLNFLHKRELIIAELNGFCEMDIAKPCVNCPRLQTYDLFDDFIIRGINISCYPSICQAKCIFCSVYTNPKNSYETAKHSHFPKMIAEMISYVKANNLLAESCWVNVAPAEITIMPHKDLVLDTVAEYNTKFLTNGFKFDQRIAASLKRNNSRISISIDAGTRETFKTIKGLNLFEKVIENLKLYNENGLVDIKYNILSGINDGDEDIDGIIQILKKLNINNITLSFDYNLPLRTAFFPIVKFIKSLKKNGINIQFHAYYTPNQIDGFVELYFTSQSKDEYVLKNNHLKEIFQTEYFNNYKAYIQYLYFIEIKDLIEKFKKGTRFALLGRKNREQYIMLAFQKLEIPLIIPDAPYKESYDMVKDEADIFIIRNRGAFDEINIYIMSKNGNEKCLLNIEQYYYSFEPTISFLMNSINEKYIDKEYIIKKHYQELLQREIKLKQELNKMETNIKLLQNEINSLKQSKSFRLGQAMTLIPRKFRSFIRRVRDNGIIDTMEYAIHLIGGKY